LTLETYLAKHSGRKLTWQNSLGFCVVRAFFPLGKKELSVSLFQAVVLALFNDVPDNGQLTLKEIQETSGIATRE
jgi:cullin-4